MGDMTYGFLSAYSSAGRYSRMLVLLLAALGFLGSFASAAFGPCTTTYTQLVSGANCGTASGSSCSTAGCGALTSIGCTTTGQQQCVTPANAIMYPLCGVYNTVHNIVFLLGVVLFILGGALYAGANVMPSASKGQIQGYGMGFILGGVVGVLIAILAPYIIGIVSGQSGASILTACQ